MGEIRAFSKHVKWSDQEISVLLSDFASATWPALYQRLPGRTQRQIQCKANAMGLERLKTPARSPAEVREAKRVHMARRREENPEAARLYARQNHAANREKRNQALREAHGRRLFWSRALRLKGITPQQLAALWRRQRGRCAITGRRLDRSAQVDHVTSRARGGTDDIENLRWTCAVANLLKREMSDEELVALCSEVVGHLGQRIATVETLKINQAAA